MTNASALLLAADSWGGVAPMITLAGALHGLGVNPRIAAYSDFSEKVRAAGCEFTDLGVSAAGFWAELNAQRPDWAGQSHADVDGAALQHEGPGACDSRQPGRGCRAR